MPTAREMTPVRTFLGRADHGADLLEELTGFCAANGITLGRVEAIGAVKTARLGYYDQNAQEYRFFEIDKHLEIAGLVGNVSLKDGKPVIHAHITLADEAGNAYGGHMVPGTVVFACEFCIQAFEGDPLVRGRDQATGLPLWDMT